ncbi:hypothetical protein BH18ACI3_BH18ACI3_00640 [soil metagenome]
MKTQTRKKTVPNRQTRTPKRRRQTPSKYTNAKPVKRIGNFFLPFFLSFCIILCLGVLGFLSYQSVTASNFFDVQTIEVHGVERSSKQKIVTIVGNQTEKSGAWNADLLEIKAKVEKIPFVRTAAVSRVLPNGIRVNVVERVPQAIVRLASGDILVDGEGTNLSPVEAKEEKLPFVMIGWDETKTEKAAKDNLERIKMYQKMLSDWQQFDLALRITTVNLADLREPKAYMVDSGMSVSIALEKDNFGEYLKKGINAIVGKGETFEAVNLVGQNMILSPRKTQ